MEKLLGKYLELAEQQGRFVEIGFHPGYSKGGENLMDGVREDFRKFYSSPWRDTEFETLMDPDLQQP